MFDVGSLVFKIGLDTSEFDKGLSQAQGQAEKSGGFLSRAFEFATGGLIVNGLSAVAGSVLNVGKSMIDGNAEFEKYQTQFGVLLGSTDAAKDRLAELAKFGASTPFELPELVQADKVLQSFGIHSQDMLTIVGDVAAGTGASFQDMALLMGKFSAGATGEALSRFQELGIATKDELAKMGIEFDKAGSMTTPVAEAMPILEQLMKDKFGGMMDAQSKTFGGMVSNLQDWVGQTTRTLGQPIFDVVKDKLGALLTFLSDPATMAALNSFAQLLATGIGGAMDFLSKTVIPNLIAAWNLIKPVVDVVMGVFLSLNKSTDDVGSNWTGLSKIINSTAAFIQSIVTTIFTAIQNFLTAHGAEIQAFLKSTWDQIGVIVKIAVDLINATIVPAFQAIAGFISAHGKEIQGILEGAWSIIQGIVKIALSIIQGVLATALALIKGDWSGAWEAIKTMFSGVWDGIKQVLGGALQIIKNELSMAWDSIKGVASSAWNGIASAISGAFDSAVASVKSSVNSIIDAVNSAIKAVNSIPGVPDLPTVPGFAVGTNFAPGGLALVGERGPELVNLPRGSQVTPANDTARMLGSSTTNYYFTAQYSTTQSESSLLQDVKMLQMLGAGT